MTPNPHRGSDFADFLAEQDLMTPTMRPTNDLTDALRRYNAWRLGDWAEPMPEPQEITRLLDDAADRLEELERELAAERALVDILAALAAYKETRHE